MGLVAAFGCRADAGRTGQEWVPGAEERVKPTVTAEGQLAGEEAAEVEGGEESKHSFSGQRASRDWLNSEETLGSSRDNSNSNSNKSS